MKIQCLLSSIFMVLACASFNCPVLAAEKVGGYGGLEFLGSSLISRVELEKLLHLKNGASYESGYKAVEKLRQNFEKRAFKADVELVNDGSNYYVTVDPIETGFKNTHTSRRLIEPHHIYMKNEKPFALFQDLNTRLEKLALEGRPASERYQDGIRLFTDVACLNLAERMMKQLQGQKPYLFEILASDPNGERRAQAAELLNWTPDPISNCKELIPALDDSDLRVRMAAAKYIWARAGMLPDTFPFDSLLEALSRQLTRPSHHDRVRALAALLALAKRDGDSITGIKTFDEAKLKEIAENSVIPSVQDLCKQLLALTSNPPPLTRQKKLHPAIEY